MWNQLMCTYFIYCTWYHNSQASKFFFPLTVFDIFGFGKFVAHFSLVEKTDIGVSVEFSLSQNDFTFVLLVCLVMKWCSSSSIIQGIEPKNIFLVNTTGNATEYLYIESTCCNGTLGHIHSSGPELYVKFTTDSSTSNKGFIISYQDVEPASNHTESSKSSQSTAGNEESLISDC